MPDLERLKLGAREPRRVVSELNRRYHRFRSPTDYNPDGIDVFEEDWDNLLILDACRYDEFRRQSELDGELDWRISRGSATKEFVTANFSGRRLSDLVYVSANSWFPKLKDEIDAEVYRYISVERDVPVGFSSRPETVSERALEAAEDNPDKRLLVHYLQPHKPFIGEWGSKRFENVDDLETTVRVNDARPAEVRRAYRENLDLVLEEVERMLDELNGKTVVTGDHGELLGERESPIPIRRYGHPMSVYVPELVRVPWLVHESGERKRVTAGSPEETSHDLRSVEEQLEGLGYI